MINPKLLQRAPYLDIFGTILQRTFNKMVAKFVDFKKRNTNVNDRQLRNVNICKFMFEIGNMSHLGEYFQFPLNVTIGNDRESKKFVKNYLQFPQSNKTNHINDIAAQITLIQFRYLQNIQPREYCGQSWLLAPPFDRRRAPNVCLAIQLFDDIVAFVQSKILNAKSSKQKITVIQQFLDVCQFFLCISFFFSRRAIHTKRKNYLKITRHKNRQCTRVVIKCMSGRVVGVVCNVC